MPGLGGKITGAGEARIDQDAQRQGPYPADAVAQPAKDQPAESRAEQKTRDEPPVPKPYDGIVVDVQEVLQGGPGDQREQSLLQAAEHPAEQSGGQREPFRPAQRFVIVCCLRHGPCTV